MTNSTDQIQALRRALADGKLPGRDREFAGKLVAAHEAGRLTFNMAQWVPRLLSRADAPESPTLKVTGVVNLLDTAKAKGLKHPKLWLLLDGVGAEPSPLRITIAGDKSKTPGYLMLTDGGGFGSGLYFGKISPQGELHLGRDGFEVVKPLTALLTRLAKDPAKVAADFGHLTGHCCFCSLPLNDPKSTRVGYGPICAEKFCLPWGIDDPKARKSNKTDYHASGLSPGLRAAMTAAEKREKAAKRTASA
jgi:hypothetical protein